IKGDVPHGRGVMRWFDATSGQHYYHIGHFEEGEFVDGKQICEGGSTSHIGGGFNWLERDFFERLRTAVDR
ncbi:MAG: hypothetical protein O7A06_01460, partial [Acidobacteria bacterium]|nr:hypothetical protein [Acidobacteriota bacterium]